MVKTDVKTKILTKGAEIIHKKGFNHAGIQEILQAAGVPKGSFYFYFKNKEEFGLELIEYYAQYFLYKQNEYQTKTEIKIIDRLRGFYNDFNPFFRDNNFEFGCPLGNFAQEMGDQNDRFREKMSEVYHLVIEKFSALIKEAQAKGEISNTLNSAELAKFIFHSWQGALIWMKVEKNTDTLKNFDEMIFEHFLKCN